MSEYALAEKTKTDDMNTVSPPFLPRQIRVVWNDEFEEVDDAVHNPCLHQNDRREQNKQSGRFKGELALINHAEPPCHECQPTHQFNVVFHVINYFHLLIGVMNFAFQ